MPVAADGTVLEGLPVTGPLPMVRARAGSRAPGSPRAAPAGRARIAGAAPAPLRRRVREIQRDGDRGYVAQLREGPELVFGSAAHLRAKWIAAARVLADPETGGATYVDLRLPGRPAVGGLPVAELTPAPTITPPAALGDGGAPAGAADGATRRHGGRPAAAGRPRAEQAPATEPPATTAPATPQAPAAPAAEAGGGAAAAPAP